MSKHSQFFFSDRYLLFSLPIAHSAGGSSQFSGMAFGGHPSNDLPYFHDESSRLPFDSNVDIVGSFDLDLIGVDGDGLCDLLIGNAGQNGPERLHINTSIDAKVKLKFERVTPQIQPLTSW